MVIDTRAVSNRKIFNFPEPHTDCLWKTASPLSDSNQSRFKNAELAGLSAYIGIKLIFVLVVGVGVKTHEVRKVQVGDLTPVFEFGT
jgi:hypothetical protein